MKRVDDTLPGAELINEGLQDLSQQKFSVPALLVCIGKSRLEHAGLAIPNIATMPTEPELVLYGLLIQSGQLDPYSYYNSLIRQLISFEQALEQRFYAS